MRVIDASRFGEIMEQWKKDCLEDNDTQGADIISDVMLQLDDIPTLPQPNDWISVEDRLPEPGERVLATDCGFVGEFYINKRGKWQRYNVNCSELLMALDILYWMPLPAPPDKDNNVPAKTPNEPLTLEQLRQMDGQPVWVDDEKIWALLQVWDDDNIDIVFPMPRGCFHAKSVLGKKIYRRPPEGGNDVS